ncbi:MAG: DUF1592 domain-containing protein [Planctomycetes bacterium]|nr:DUF1592 domain-containing protein [Planctomycetota bacterium]
MTKFCKPSFLILCNRANIASLLVLCLAATKLPAQDESFQKVVAPFLQTHCIACHGPKKQESRLRLDEVTGVQAGNRNLWTMVHERIAASEMPPKEARPQPNDADKKKILAWIAERQRALGPGGTRRLNRRELSAALRDVTGLQVDFAQALPGDGTVGGFDTGAEALQEASDAVAQWLQVTRRAVAGIHFLESAKGKSFTANFRDVQPVKKGPDPYKKIIDGWKEQGANVKLPGQLAIGRPGVGLLLAPRTVGEQDTFSFTIPTRPDREGVLRLTIIISAMKPMEGLPNSHLWVKVGGREIDYREIVGTMEKPMRLVYEVQLGDVIVQSKGVSIHLSNKVEIPYAVKGYENEDRTNPKDKNPPPKGTGPFRPLFDRKTTPPEKQPAPYLVLHQLQIEPDVTVAWPPREWRVTSDEWQVKDNLDCAKRLLGIWIDRAWRRPVTEAEQAPFLKLYEKLRAKGMSFDDALRAAFQSVLMSAAFRYQASPAHPDGVVAQHAIGARLSFMLTGAPPDAELRRLAVAGKLRDPGVLDAQVDRLLAGRASDGFFRPFVMQWLEMEQPITIAQDYIQEQHFRWARYYKASMREETIRYIAHLFHENRPARELIVSDWTMMNDALAIHYGYPAIDSGELRKVKLRPDDPRGGGILGQAGIQSMLCWMGENWVIYRGAWTMRHILDQPPPPPPLEVPELNPSEAKNKGKPFRELLKQHQQDNRCSVCHKSIDPVGFAFQNFDLSGRWRKVEFESYARGELDGRVSWRGVGKTRPVDSVGALPRGEQFKTFDEFKGLIVKHYQDDLMRGILKNLTIYSTGRLPGIDDRMEIAAIMKKYRSQEYPLRDMLKAIVRSQAFLEQPSKTPPSLGRSSP